jgi:hypothetical protein
MQSLTPHTSLQNKNDLKISGLHESDKTAIIEKLNPHRPGVKNSPGRASGRQQQNKMYSSTSFQNVRQSKVQEKMKEMSVLPDDLSESEDEEEMDKLRQAKHP